MADSRFCLFSCFILTFMSNFSSQDSGRYPAGCRSCQLIPNTFKNCSEECRIPIALNDRDTKQILFLMEAQHLKISWFGLRRIHLGAFLWLDNKEPNGSFTRRSWLSRSNCAYVNVRDKQIDAGPCHFRTKGVICQVNRCGGCTHLSVDQTNCMKINNTCYIKQPYSFTWEEAKAVCIKNGWEMAVLSGKEDRMTQQLTKAFKQKTTHHYENFFWVGLRREEWRFNVTGPASEKIALSHWAHDEPKKGMNCSVIVKQDKGSPIWRSVSCTSKFNSLCISNTSKITPSGKPITVTPAQINKATKHNVPPIHEQGNIGLTEQEVDDQQGLHVWSISSITLMGFLLVIIVAFISFYCLTRIKRSDIKGIQIVLNKILQIVYKELSNNNENQTKLPRTEEQHGGDEGTSVRGLSHSQSTESAAVAVNPGTQTTQYSSGQDQITPLLDEH